MTSFITRVELHGASGAEYAQLHAEMTFRGFKQKITANDGVVYDLPTAMYLFETSGTAVTAEVVREQARRAAEVTGRNHWVLTAAYTEIAWLLNSAKSP